MKKMIWQKLLKEKGFLIGIIADNKGLSESNYIYVPEVVKKGNPELFQDCVDSGLAESYILANFTLKAVAIKTEEELEDFLNGKYNSDIEELKALNPDIDYSDWYWTLRDENIFPEEEPESTLEGILNLLGSSAPFDEDGDLSPEGIDAVNTLKTLLKICKNLDIIPDWNEDKIDEIENDK